MGTINENAKTISVNLNVACGTPVSALVATFSTTGVKVEVGSVVQVSGSTPDNFTSPVVYTVVATDGSTAVYTVTVTAILQHLNGLGQIYLDCSPLNTFTQTTATEAAQASTIGGTLSTATCGVAPNDSQVVTDVGASTAAVWAYSGSLAGHVHLNSSSNAATCPISTDPAWN